MISDHAQRSRRSGRFLRFALLAMAMAVIFVVDTAMNYEVAAAVFYAVVILMAARGSSRHALVALTGLCVAVTFLSFSLTPQGNFRTGLINMGISITVILMTTWLVLKMQTATAAANDAQARLMRIARVTSLEGLTTSIAHEVNQPLAAIVASGNAGQRWLAQDPPNIGKASQALERILGDAGRASAIIARVRGLTKGEPPHRSEFDVNQALLEVVASSQGEIDRRDILLSTELGAGLPLAMADRVQTQQVIGNVLLNAIESVASSGKPVRRIRITSELDDGRIVLSMFDTGVGLPQAAGEQLFEAFWTTKENGIGVGLSISRTLVEANGGQIWAEPLAEGGAVFRFSIPTAVQAETRDD